MVDKNTIFGGMLTTFGAAKKTNCDALGIPWEPRYMLIGDANGTDPIPDPLQTKLINQVYRAQLNQLYVSPTDDKVLVAELVLPPDIGGWWVRELALEDKDGVFSAVSNVAPSYKPQLAQNSGRNQVVRMHIITSSTANIQLKIDPSVVLATREYVDNKILEELYKLDNKQSVRVATTANIALAGLQVLDGVTLLAGDRVLVKNQTVAKDNGIYIAGAPAWVRAPDADTNAEVTSALLVSVEQGTALADTRWQLVTDGVIVLGTTPLTFQNVTQGFAPINSPALISPTANTPAQFDNSQLLINSAFLKRAGVEYSNLNSVGVSTVLTNSSIGSLVSAASATPINVTLPPTTGLPQGATIEIANAGAGGSVTVLASGADVLVSQAGVVVPIVLGAGDNAYFIKVSNEWRLRGGSIALKYAAVMSGPNWTTPAQFTSDKSFATTEFLKRQGLQFSSQTFITANTVLTAAHVGALIETSAVGTLTLTLPATTVAPGGGAIWFFNDSPADVIINRVGADIIAVNSAVSLTTITLKPGDTLTLVTNGGTKWLAVGGSAQLGYSAAFAASLVVNGHQKLPSGKMEMWGNSGSVPSGGYLDVTLPSTFPIECLEAFATPVGGGNITTSISFAVSIISPSIIRIYHFHGGGGAANYRFHVIGR